MRLLTLLCALGALPLTLTGQMWDPVQVGARVRLTIEDHRPKRVIGVLVGKSQDTLLVQLLPRAAPEGIPRARILTYEVSRERRGNAGRFAGQGFLFGFGVGIVGVAAGGCQCGSPVLAAIVGGALFGGLFALPSALIGAFTSHDVWTRVP